MNDVLRLLCEVRIGCIAGVANCEHPYSMGRPGSNNSAASILNTFAAIRIIPAFFYNAYEPGDKRRDVSMVVTGSNAATGREDLVPLGVGPVSAVAVRVSINGTKTEGMFLHSRMR